MYCRQKLGESCWTHRHNDPAHRCKYLRKFTSIAAHLDLYIVFPAPLLPIHLTFHLLLQAVIEALLGFALALGGVLLAAGQLKPIRATDEVASKTLDMVNARPEFDVFAHRGRALAQRLRRACTDGANDESKKLD